MPAAAVLTAAALGPGSPRSPEVVSQTKLTAPACHACFSSLRSQRAAIQMLTSQRNWSGTNIAIWVTTSGVVSTRTEDEICHNHVASEAGRASGGSVCQF